MLIKVRGSALIVIDVQERLISAMAAPAHAIKNAQMLLKVAAKSMVPILLTEQYSEGLGPTVAALKIAAGPAPILPKLHFSCMQDSPFANAFTSLNRRQAILTSMQTNVCGVQTTASLVDLGYEVVVVSDASASRTLASERTCLARLTAAGVSIVTTEMVIFEWLGQAGTPAFKEILPLIKQHELTGDMNEHP